jgi:hypothetical protein
MTINAVVVQKITDAALEFMAKRASNLEPGESYTTADIAATVVADPTGNTALYLAKLIVTGVEHYGLFRSGL